jgi:hypothetical protein
MPVASPAEDASSQLERELWNEMMRHPGKWIVATESRIIAIGDDAQEVLKIAGSQGVDEPLLFHVPEDPGISFLL